MVPVDLARLRKVAFSAMVILQSAEGIQFEYLGDGMGRGEANKPKTTCPWEFSPLF